MSSLTNKEADSHWLDYLETLDEIKEESKEIKEESVEIKEEPLDDMADIKPEDLLYFSPDYFNRDPINIKEDGNSADIKKEEPIFDLLNTNVTGPVEIKEEDPIDDFFDIKEEELTSLPIADVFCPSTGDSRPLNINLYEGMHSRRQIDPSRSSLIWANSSIALNGSFSVNRSPGEIESTSFPIDSMLPRIGHALSDLLLKECAFCGQGHAIGAEMERHVRSMHPEELEQINRQMLDADSRARIIHPQQLMKYSGVNLAFARETDGRASKDEQLAVANGLPISAAKIVDMPLFDLNQLIKAYSLTEQQRDLMRQIRRRGQIKVSARAHRKRRSLTHIDQTLD